VLVREGHDALVVLPDFEWANPPSVTGLARKGNVWTLPPVLYLDGRETYRFLAPSKVELQSLIGRLRRLGDVEILSVSTRTGLDRLRGLPSESVPFVQGLTDRQARSLVAAYEGGLFHVPARSGWDEVARREGLSRSTFGEHLRKAQLRLLTNCYPTLKARAWGREEGTLLPATGRGPATRRSPLQGTRPRSDRDE
jgi:predicted DNA binding protein